MALSGTFTTNGFSVPGSYVIARAQVLTSVGWASVLAEVYPSQEARHTWPGPLFTVQAQFQYDLNAPQNLYAQSYDYLLTLPEFAGFAPV
jgi:hypothetical protein